MAASSRRHTRHRRLPRLRASPYARYRPLPDTPSPTTPPSGDFWNGLSSLIDSSQSNPMDQGGPSSRPLPIGLERPLTPGRQRYSYRQRRSRSPSPSKIIVDEWTFDPVGSTTNPSRHPILIQHESYVNPSNDTYELDPFEPEPERLPPLEPEDPDDTWASKQITWDCGHTKYEVRDPDGVSMAFLQDHPVGVWSLGIENVRARCPDCREEAHREFREADNIVRRRRRHTVRKKVNSCLEECFQGIQRAFFMWWLGGGPSAAKIIREEEERDGIVSDSNSKRTPSESPEREPRDGYEAMDMTMKKWQHELRDLGRGRKSLRQRGKQPVRDI